MGAPRQAGLAANRPSQRPSIRRSSPSKASAVEEIFQLFDVSIATDKLNVQRMGHLGEDVADISLMP